MDERFRDPSDPAVTVAGADAILRRLAVERARNDHAICRWLVRADELQVERVFGYGSIREYAERVFGFGSRAVEDRLRVGRALGELLHLNEAFASGELRYTTVRELCRVATAETEAEWITAASGRTGTEVARMVAARERGDRPTDPGEDRIVPRRVTLTLSPQAYALLETARTEATRGAGEHVDDSAFVTEVVLGYLNRGGDRDAGRAAFQIALTVDPHGGAVMNAGGEAIVVDEAFVEMARCDAQHVGVVDGDGSAAERATRDIPPRTRREVELRHGRHCAVPGCTHDAFVHIHHVTPRSEGGTHDPDELVLLCSNHHDAAHRGALVVRGSFRACFQFFHADGRPYGSAEVDARCAEVMRDAFEALRGLGFKEKEVRAMLDRVGGAEMDVPGVLRLALKHADLSRVVGVREAVVPYARCG